MMARFATLAIILVSDSLVSRCLAGRRPPATVARVQVEVRDREILEVPIHGIGHRALMPVQTPPEPSAIRWQRHAGSQ